MIFELHCGILPNGDFCSCVIFLNCIVVYFHNLWYLILDNLDTLIKMILLMSYFLLLYLLLLHCMFFLGIALCTFSIILLIWIFPLCYKMIITITLLFQVPESYTKPYDMLIYDRDRKTYAGMMSCLDESVANVTG